ncbi:MAG: ABC transporter ATP-binding protein [Cyclobacteriaceae bacterium]
MLQIKSLVFGWPGSAAMSFPDFQVSAGQSMLLLGGSGSGKTTLLHLIGGLLRPLSGTVFVHGTEIPNLSGSEIDAWRGKHIGFIFQKHFLLPSLTVKQNLQIPGWLSGSAVSSEEVSFMLDNLGLSEKGESFPDQLSYGQQQRIAIGRALINKPDLILADEPTSALDDKNCMRVIDLLKNLCSRNGTGFLVATHDQRLKEVIPDYIQL